MDINVFNTPVKRSDLPRVLGCQNSKDKDRMARNIVSELQEEYNIVNMQDGKGYFLASKEQARVYAMKEIHRGTKIVRKGMKMLRRCEDDGDYTKIPVQAHFRRIKKKPENDNQISFL